MKKERKWKKWIHTQNLRRFPVFTVVVVTFFVKILDDFHDFVSECVSFQRKINNPFWGVIVFPKKSDNFLWTSNKNTHFTEEINEQNSLRSSLSAITLLEQYNYSSTTNQPTTTTTTTNQQQPTNNNQPKPTNNNQPINEQPSNNQRTTNEQPTNNQRTTNEQPTSNQPATNQQPTNNQPTTNQPTTTTTTTGVYPKCDRTQSAFSFVRTQVVDMSLHGDHGSAWRRRERRLRAQWRHEQQSIAMALAAAQHHSAPKSAGPVSHNVLRNQNTAREGTEFYAMSMDSDVVGGGRPPSLEPRPQERVQRHTMEHIVDFVCCAPLVHTLDAPVPQTVEQLPDVLQFFDRLSTVPERVLEVHQIFTENVPMRVVLRDTQLAKQLVEVPTIIYNPLLLLLQALLDWSTSSGLWSRTFQLLVVVELVEVFPVFSQDRIIL